MGSVFEGQERGVCKTRGRAATKMSNVFALRPPECLRFSQEKKFRKTKKEQKQKRKNTVSEGLFRREGRV